MANDLVKRVYGSLVPVLDGENLTVRILVSWILWIICVVVISLSLNFFSWMKSIELLGNFLISFDGITDRKNVVCSGRACLVLFFNLYQFELIFQT